MDTPKTLKRTITPEIQASRTKDTEIVLDNYRESLNNRGVSDGPAVENFLAGEREKMAKEYESLDRGDTTSNAYQAPTDWDSIAAKMQEQQVEEDNEMTM